ncbi:hypothetical protein SAMN02746089_02516 [Caldanaerobius fijiensis DSM 17918]|uniref:Phage derived protein Gp49-like n=1 Tax=Caldanaerobius fijiensis DSM 17918 TaxID=1121256 RepID=A0A1M5EBF9_9THEO|nr:hypothetical protein [Caldanaerobius fijiensis]SHF76526.1 hypothetical protein SAMN02746089_02516 [Caldanaerobius fijiensis DSM 17918]
MKFELLISEDVEKDIQAFGITKKNVEKRMRQIFSYIPKDYDFVDTTIDKYGKTYRIMFGVCGIEKDKITVECLSISDPERKPTGPTVKEYLQKRNVREVN